MKIKSLYKTFTDYFKDCHEKLWEKEKGHYFIDIVYHGYRENLDNVYMYVYIVSLDEKWHNSKNIKLNIWHCYSIIQNSATKVSSWLKVQY
jgi:hypothetical protein